MIQEELNHMKFIYERMQYVHKEPINIDYMIKFRKILQKLQTDITTINC